MDKGKAKKEPLTEHTLIGSRKITKTELLKFFNEKLGEDYEKNAVAMDILKRMFPLEYGSPLRGRALKEVIEECFNPSWSVNMDESITSFRVQRETKAKIEDAIPHYLSGDMQKTALDFAAYLQANKLKWDAWNKWKVFYIKTTLCWVTLNLSTRSWVVSPCLPNNNEYQELVLSEGLQDFVWDNFKRCNPNCAGVCGGPTKSVTILGKEIYGICCEITEVNNYRVDYVNPDETTINRIKMLLELEKQART